MPKVLIALRSLGVRSEVWAWRQIRALRALRPSVLAWNYENRRSFPLDDVPIHLLDTEVDPHRTRRAWRWRLRNLPAGNFYGTQGTERREVLRILESEAPDVILCHFGHTALRLLPAAEALGIPLVAHFHGLDISSGLGNRWYRWSLRQGLPRFAAAVCVGTRQREILRSFGMPDDRLHLIPCGVPTDAFPLKPHADARPVTFITVSRLVEWKGTHHALAAFARVAPELPGSRLLIVGDGPEKTRLAEQAAALGVRESVFLVGPKSEEEVRTLLLESDVFLQHSLDHPSGWFEGFGVSIAEAASCGLPVVVSACGGILDQVVDGTTGSIVAQTDEAAMAAAMLRLGRDAALRTTMGEAGRERMIRHFDTAGQVRKLEQVLLGACTSRAAA